MLPSRAVAKPRQLRYRFESVERRLTSAGNEEYIAATGQCPKCLWRALRVVRLLLLDGHLLICIMFWAVWFWRPSLEPNAR
jgi:hypothetical protein